MSRELERATGAFKTLIKGAEVRENQQTEEGSPQLEVMSDSPTASCQSRKTSRTNVSRCGNPVHKGSLLSSPGASPTETAHKSQKQQTVRDRLIQAKDQMEQPPDKTQGWLNDVLLVRKLAPVNTGQGETEGRDRSPQIGRCQLQSARELTRLAFRGCKTSRSLHLPARILEFI